MLYLVMGFDKDENDNLIKLIKIGFSDNLNTRENQYKSSGILMGFMKTLNPSSRAKPPTL